MHRNQIFISYRRDDAAGYARAVYDALAQRFGDERVFMDVDDIGAGQPFDQVLQQAVGGSLVLLVLIGRRWRGEREGAPARIHDAGDFVRHEVATALARGMTVIPLLLDGAAMPAEAELPDDLRALSRRNALALDNSRFAADIERLAAALRAAVGDGAAPPPPRNRRALLIGAGAGVGLLAAGGALVLSQRTPRRAAVNGRWQASLRYDWMNSDIAERFDFGGEGSSLIGTASFLRVPRPLLEGRVDDDSLQFVTRTSELGSGREYVHRYQGRLADGTLRLVMQTEGAASTSPPLHFVARRSDAPG